MDRAESFSFPPSPTALLRSRAIARAALLCLLLAALPTLAQAGTAVDSMGHKVNVTGGQRIGTLESGLIQLMSDGLRRANAGAGVSIPALSSPKATNRALVMRDGA